MTHRYQQSVFKRYHSDKHFSQFLPTRRRQKSAGTNMEQNYVTVTPPIATYIAWTVCVSVSLAQGTITVLDGARIYHYFLGGVANPKTLVRNWYY